MSEGARGCAESLIRLHILQQLYSACLEIGYILGFTSLSSTGFIISSIVNKISAYAHSSGSLCKSSFLNELLAYSVLCHQSRRERERVDIEDGIVTNFSFCLFLFCLNHHDTRPRIGKNMVQHTVCHPHRRIRAQPLCCEDPC